MGVACIGSRQNQIVFGGRYARKDQTRLILLIGNLQLLKYALNQTLGIGRIVNGKTRWKFEMLRLHTKNTCKNRVKSTHHKREATSFPVRAAMRSFISRAALLVKVKANTLQGGTPCCKR